MRLNLIACVTFVVSFNCVAKPVILDTPDATVIIVRPIDQWSGDKDRQNFSLKGFQAKCFSLSRHGNNVDGSLVDRVQEESTKLGFSTCMMGGDKGAYLSPEAPVTLIPSEMDSFNKVQDYLFKGSVILQGDPATLQDRVSQKRTVGNVVEFLTFAVATKIGLSSGFGGANSLNLGLNVSNGVGSYPLDAEFRIRSENMPLLKNVPYDYSKFNSVDIRKINSTPLNVTNGEIIIGYKKVKTAELESELLTRAYVIAGGLDSNTAEFVAARQEDYQARLKIWNDCVAKGECKND